MKTKSQKALTKFNRIYNQYLEKGYSPIQHLSDLHARVNSGNAQWNVEQMESLTPVQMSKQFKASNGELAYNVEKMYRKVNHAKDLVAYLNATKTRSMKDGSGILPTDTYNMSPAMQEAVDNIYKGNITKGTKQMFASRISMSKNIERKAMEEYVSEPFYNKTNGAFVLTDPRTFDIAAKVSLTKATAYEDARTTSAERNARDIAQMKEIFNGFKTGVYKYGAAISEQIGSVLALNKGLREKYTVKKGKENRVDFTKLANFDENDFDATDPNAVVRPLGTIARLAVDKLMQNTGVNKELRPSDASAIKRAAKYTEKADLNQNSQIMQLVKDKFSELFKYSPIFDYFFGNTALDSDTSQTNMITAVRIVNENDIDLEALYNDMVLLHPDNSTMVSNFINDLQNGKYRVKQN
nr:MAG TPA: hypothetical protein [Caudoviricetes sp.]